MAAAAAAAAVAGRRCAGEAADAAVELGGHGGDQFGDGLGAVLHQYPARRLNRRVCRAGHTKTASHSHTNRDIITTFLSDDYNFLILIRTHACTYVGLK